MKKFSIPIALFVLGIMTVSIPAYAIDPEVNANTSVRVDANSNSEVSNGGYTRDEIKNKILSEKNRLQNINQAIVQRTQEFKQNLAKIKSAPISEKKTFIVKTYSETYAFLTKTHDQFVVALNKGEAEGIAVEEARAHFATAWNILTTANNDLNTFTKMDVKTANVAEAKALAKKIEAAYIKVRQEMHAGATSLKIAIQKHVATPVSTDTDSQ